MSGTRVLVTGIGLCVPPGLSHDEVVDRARTARSAVGPIRRFDATGHACAASAEVPPFDVAAGLRIPKNQKFMGRSVECGVKAALQALAAARYDVAGIDARRFGMYVGCGQTGLEPDEFFAALDLAETGEEATSYRNLGGRASRLVDRYWSLRTLANAGLGLMAAELSVQGPCSNFVQGDTASAQAISAAYFDLIEGRCDAVLAGGYDSLLTISTYLSYERAGLLSARAPESAYRPFDRERDGLVLGEGAAFLLLEREEDARRRAAPVFAELVGAGVAQDAIDRPCAKASASAPRRALGEAIAGMHPDFAVAHGIGTPADDRMETAILADIGLGDSPITAFKGLTGYLGAATAAVELSIGILAARARQIPPIAGLASPDEGCPLDLVGGTARPLDAEQPAFVSLSWSWSGQCAALAARIVEA